MECQSLGSAIQDYDPFETHQAFVARLRAKHLAEDRLLEPICGNRRGSIMIGAECSLPFPTCWPLSAQNQDTSHFLHSFAVTRPSLWQRRPSSVTRDWTRSSPLLALGRAGEQLNWRASIGEFALESHLDRDGAFRRSSSARRARNASGVKQIRVDHPPRCRSEGQSRSLRRDIVGMVRIPYVRVPGSVRTTP